METTTELRWQAKRLAQLAEEAPSVRAAVGQRDAVIEPKFDGWRVLAHVGDDGVSLWTRSGNAISGKLPEVEDELRENFPSGTWLDGEAVAFTLKDGCVSDEWGSVQSILGSRSRRNGRDKITFVVFDMLAHGGIDARSLPLRQRRALLEAAFESFEGERIMLAPQLPPTQANYDALVATGFEGAVVKLLDSRYASGKRGYGWAKVKAVETADAFVIGFKAGKGSNLGKVGALILGQYDNGGIVEVASVKVPTTAERKAITEGGDDYLYRVVEFTYMGRVGDGGYRHPQFSRFRLDKAPEECVVGL
jgi:bifunctional non-homologous end joining protein LigD